MKFIITEEQNEKLNHKVRTMVNKYGIEHTLKMFDNNENIIRKAYQDNPYEYLNNFNDLIRVDKNEKIWYYDKEGRIIFSYYPEKRKGPISVNYYRIWVFLQKIFNFTTSEVQNMLKDWLEKTYNIEILNPSQIID